MFDFVFELLIDFIGILGWYVPMLILFSLLYGFFDFRRKR